MVPASQFFCDSSMRPPARVVNRCSGRGARSAVHPLMAQSIQMDPIEQLLADFRRATPLRTGSLIVTIFGDLIAPQGGEVRLASLLPLLRYIGVNDSQARTAVSRLVADGWLERRGDNGRRGLYGISESGRPRFEEAARRIYHEPAEAWDGRWHIILIPHGQRSARNSLRKELGWIGFGGLSSTAVIHPNPNPRALAATLTKFAHRVRPLVVAGRDVAKTPDAVLQQLAGECWKLDRLAAAHRRLIEQFTPLRHHLAGGCMPGAAAAAAGRILLIHAYRRVVLRDPQLPAPLLPCDWVGLDSRRLVGEIYRYLEPMVTEWSGSHLTGPKETLPPPDSLYVARFNEKPSAKG